jgi:hypothetical protein
MPIQQRLKNLLDFNRWTPFVLLSSLACVGCRPDSQPVDSSLSRDDAGRSSPVTDDQHRPTPPQRLFAESLGTAYRDVTARVSIQLVSEVRLPVVNGRRAIWGASGRDERGHLWFGISVGGARSAHLIEYDPQTDTAIDRGGVLENLATSGHLTDGMSQTKIHSKIWQADDGYLYFTSSDEDGEREDGTQLPRWGSHLWRYDPGQSHWEHLMAVPEALIATACSGRYVYALGYFNHTLYQWDTVTATSRSTVIGAPGGHVSRNVICDPRGHVYVPRVSDLGRIPNAEQFSDDRVAISNQGGRAFASSLVELDANLVEIQQVALVGYDPDSGFSSHGITAFSYFSDGRIALGSHSGSLHLITPGRANEPASIQFLCRLDDAEKLYPGAMICLDGKRWLAIMVGENGRDWRRCDVENGMLTKMKASGLDQIDGRKGLLLYGSHTRGDDGSAYIVGCWNSPGGIQPLVLRMQITSP